MSTEDSNQKDKLLQLVQQALQCDNELRDKYQIGNKFRFIRDRLQALYNHVEENLRLLEKEEKSTTFVLTEDEVLVYLYIFNAQGLVLKSWQKLIHPSVFYEYSINRPVYTSQTDVEAFIRSKTNKAQNGYIILAVKKQDIIRTQETEKLKDAFGNTLIKVKEGSFHFDRLVSFMHNDHAYVLNEKGDVVKKQDDTAPL